MTIINAVIVWNAIGFMLTVAALLFAFRISTVAPG